MSSSERISSAEAVQRVGKMLFGEQWIPELTAHEVILCKEYAFIDPRDIAQTYGIGNEIVQALHRAKLQLRQQHKVHEWLEANGLTSVDGRTLDAVAFERKLSAVTKPAAGGKVTIGSSTPASAEIQKTGAPGRPTSMHLVEIEYRARWDRGEARVSIGAEAKALADWLQKTHPDAPRLKPKTIGNRLREEHRERVAQSRK